MVKKYVKLGLLWIYLFSCNPILAFSVTPLYSQGNAQKQTVHYKVVPGQNELLLSDTFLISCSDSVVEVASMKFTTTLPQGMIPVMRVQKTYIDKKVEMVVEFVSGCGASADTPQCITISCLAVDGQAIIAKSIQL